MSELNNSLFWGFSMEINFKKKIDLQQNLQSTRQTQTHIYIQLNLRSIYIFEFWDESLHASQQCHPLIFCMFSHKYSSRCSKPAGNPKSFFKDTYLKE